MADIQKPYDKAIALVNGQLERVAKMESYCDRCIAVLLMGEEPDGDLPEGFYSFDTLKFALDQIESTAEAVRKFANSDDPSMAEAEAAVRVFKGLSAEHRREVIELMNGYTPVQAGVEAPEPAAVKAKKKPTKRAKKKE